MTQDDEILLTTVEGVPVYASDLDVTPNDDLRELVDELRDRRSDHGGIPEEWVASDAYDHAADLLEELIEDQ